MKKTIVLGLLLAVLCGSAGLFAEDAEVLPAQIGRVSVGTTYAFTTGWYDGDGKYKAFESNEGKMNGLTLSFALEYGIIDWITFGAQWAPGWVVWSDVDTVIDLTQLGGPLSKSSVNGNGLFDLFVGLKIKLVGEDEKYPLQNDAIRIAIGPGVLVPLPGADFEKQLKNAQQNDPVTGDNMNKHVLGVGGRFWIDVYSGPWTIHLYDQFLGFPIKGKITDKSLEDYATYEQVKKILASGGSFADEVSYGYSNNTEIEVDYTLPVPVGPGKLTFGGKVNYSFASGVEYAKPDAAALSSLTSSPMGGNPFKDTNDSHTITLSPIVIYGMPLGSVGDIEFNLSYAADVYNSVNSKVHYLKPSITLYTIKVQGINLLEANLSWNAPILGWNKADARHDITLSGKMLVPLKSL